MHYYSNDPETLARLAEEYRFLGRHVKVDGDTLTVFALPPKKQKKKVEAKKTDESRKPETREQKRKDRR